MLGKDHGGLYKASTRTKEESKRLRRERATRSSLLILDLKRHQHCKNNFNDLTLVAHSAMLMKKGWILLKGKSGTMQYKIVNHALLLHSVTSMLPQG